MQSLAVDDLDGLLREWAEWAETCMALGHSDSTPIWRANFGHGSGTFASAPPRRVELLEIRGALRRLVQAMDALTEDDDTRKPVSAVQLHYLYGPQNGLIMFGGSKTKYFEAIRTGEALIKREIKRW